MSATRPAAPDAAAPPWLRHGPEILAALLANSPDVVYVKDRQGRYLAINQNALRIVGLREDQVLGHDDTAIMPAASARKVMESDARVFASGETLTFEMAGQFGQGRYVFHSVRLPFRDEHGEVAGLICVARDITARKRAEEQQRFLAEASALLDSSLDYETTLQRVAHLAVPTYADVCSVDLIEPNGRIRRVASANVDPS